MPETAASAASAFSSVVRFNELKPRARRFVFSGETQHILKDKCGDVGKLSQSDHLWRIGMGGLEAVCCRLLMMDRLYLFGK